MAWTTRNDSHYPRVIVPFTTPVSVSTETPLMSLTELGSEYADLVFTLRNHDATNLVAFYLEQSETGSVNDEEREAVYVAALKERTMEFRDILRLNWGIAAAGNPDGGFPSVLVSFQVVGRLRP